MFEYINGIQYTGIVLTKWLWWQSNNVRECGATMSAVCSPWALQMDRNAYHYIELINVETRLKEKYTTHFDWEHAKERHGAHEIVYTRFAGNMKFTWNHCNATKPIWFWTPRIFFFFGKCLASEEYTNTHTPHMLIFRQVDRSQRMPIQTLYHSMLIQLIFHNKVPSSTSESERNRSVSIWKELLL